MQDFAALAAMRGETKAGTDLTRSALDVWTTHIACDVQPIRLRAPVLYLNATDPAGP